jgi:LysR family cyn operon transcriptional activator
MNPIASALALVRRMAIGAIISRQALIEVKDLCIIPIENPTPMRTPGILWNRDRQPTAAAKSFAVILRNAVLGTPMASRGRRNGNGQRFAGTMGKTTKLSRLAAK